MKVFLVMESSTRPNYTIDQECDGTFAKKVFGNLWQSEDNAKRRAKQYMESLVKNVEKDAVSSYREHEDDSSIELITYSDEEQHEANTRWYWFIQEMEVV